MAKTDKNTLKGWFKNGDYPNQDQFWSWMDSYWHKDDPIDMEAIQGLAALLAGKATDQDIINLNQRIDQIIAGGGGGGVGGVDVFEYIDDASYTMGDSVLLEKLVIIPDETITLTIGDTNGTTEIMGEQECPGGVATVVGIDVYAHQGERQIFLNGITVKTIVKYYRR